jgi:S1-C subfamily serine protease
MLKLVVTVSCLMMLVGQGVHARSKVIYGVDNRVEVIDATNLLHQQLATSTAAMVDKSRFSTINGKTSVRVETLQQAFNVCPSERFYDQPALAHCSGFLVGPDLLITAGHCVIPASKGGNQCERFSWVFDYRSDLFDENDFDRSNIYNCKEVLVHELDPMVRSDFALIRLDRPVRGRPYLSVRSQGQVSVGDELVVIGHPSGLPTKIADGAVVVRNDDPQFFVADLDTYGGNSGSAVFNATTGLVEGILVRGAMDYVRSPQGCLVSNICSEVSPGRCGGESVSRVSLVGLQRYLR